MTKETKIVKMAVFLLLIGISMLIYYKDYWEKEAYHFDSINLMRNCLSMRLPSKADIRNIELANKFGEPTFRIILRPKSITDITDYINGLQTLGFTLKERNKNAKNEVMYMLIKEDQTYILRIFADGDIVEDLRFVDSDNRWR